MKPAAWFHAESPLRAAWRPVAMRWVMQDLAGVARQPEQDHRTHLRASLEWLCRAQDTCLATAAGSVAAGWSFRTGWLPPSPDATARLIETFVPAADYLVWPELKDRAHAMHTALLTQPDTASAARIMGLIAGHVHLDAADGLQRALACGRLLCEAGYDSPARRAEAGWALAMLGKLSGDAAIVAAARRHLADALALQTPCGWFRDDRLPVSTTALATTLRSLIEAAGWLGDPALLRTASRGARDLGRQLQADGRLPGAHDDGWTPASDHVCIAGLTRLSAAWMRLAQIEGGQDWRDTAWRALAWIKRSQRRQGDDLAVRDALPSTAPIWAGPAAFRLDALTLKYFADALMMDMVGIAIPQAAQKAGPP